MPKSSRAGARIALTWTAAVAGVAGVAAAACVSGQNNGPGPLDGGPGLDATTPPGTDGAPPNGPDGATPNDGGSPPVNCSDAATGPLGLTCADFPGNDPCPNQAVLTDATKFAALQAAMKSGVILHADIPYNASDNNIYKEKCGLEGYWDPTKATALVPPATGIPEIAALLAPSSDGNAGICASYTGSSTSTDGFPAAGTYRVQFQAAYQGQTFVVRARAKVSGSAAGQSFAAAGLDAGSTPGLAGSLVYQVNGTTAAEPTLWTSIVSAFGSSTTSFPEATVTVMQSAGGAAVWTAVIDLLCASEKAAPAAGPGVVTVQDTIPLAASPGAITFNTATKKAYVALSSRSDAGFTVSDGIAVIDDATNAVKTTITTPNSVVTMASNGTTSTVYASEQQAIDIIDSTTDTITKTVTVPNNEAADGLAVDETAGVVYVLGGSHIYSLGANGTFAGTSIAFTGMTPPTAAFSGGKPALALDTTSNTLYAIGLDQSLNGVLQTFDAGAGTHLSTYALQGNQPIAIAVVPGVGAVAAVVSTSGSFGLLLAGQSTLATTSFSPASVARCGTTIAALGSDLTGLAGFATFAPTSSALGNATTYDSSELQENGEVPAGIVTAATSGGGCVFYATYNYNGNVLYSNTTGYAPMPPPYVVKLVND